jgi:hypothetical protein
LPCRRNPRLTFYEKPSARSGLVPREQTRIFREQGLQEILGVIWLLPHFNEVLSRHKKDPSHRYWSVLRARRESHGNGREFGQRRLKVLGDLLGKHLGRWQILRVFKRIVTEPNQVEAHLVPLE